MSWDYDRGDVEEVFSDGWDDNEHRIDNITSVLNSAYGERDEARKQVKEARTVARYLRDTVLSMSQTAFVDGLLLQPFHDENNQPPDWLTNPGSPDDPDAIHLLSTSIDPKENEE